MALTNLLQYYLLFFRQEMKKIIFAFFVVSSLLFSCKGGNIDHSEQIIVATFNMSWLGDGTKDLLKRNEKDYRNIAEAITELDADIIACQEIENVAAIRKVSKYLPNHNFVISRAGSAQKLAIFYRKSIHISNVRELTELQLDNERLRPALVVNFKNKNFDFELVNIHLKSTSGFDIQKNTVKLSRDIRRKQARLLNKWLNNYIANNTEQDVIIIGDFNDTPKRQKYNTLNSFLSNEKLSFLTADLKSCGKYSNSYVIDNILVTNSAKNRVLLNSVGMLDLYSLFPANEIKRISDHCPVFATFDCTAEDND